MPEVTGSLTLRCLGHCLARSLLVGSTFNPRGLQNVGLIYAMEPGLRRIYPDPAARRLARKSYMGHYNTHLFWTPLLLGVFLGLEAQIAQGRFPRHVLDSLRDTTVYTLSALGDSAFGGSLLVFWSLSGAMLAVAGPPWQIAVWTLVWLVALQAFKVLTFYLGLRDGLKVLNRLKRWNLMLWAARLKLVNAGLLAALLGLLWQASGLGAAVGPMFVPAAAWLLLVALMAWRFPFLRELLLLAALMIYVALPWLSSLL